MLRDILGCMREGELDEQLYDKLKSRVVGADIASLNERILASDGLEDTLVLAGLRGDVRSLNSDIRKCRFPNVPMEVIKAQDSVVKSFRGCTAETSSDVDGVVHENCKLPASCKFDAACDTKFSMERELVLCVGLEVVVISNIDKDEQLFNGAKALVEHIDGRRLTLWPGGK